MANTIRIKRRAANGSTGAPSSLKSAELAYNMADNTVYIGYGDDGDGNATSVKPVGGDGTFAKLDSPALTGTPTAPTPASNDDSTKIATTEYVQNVVSSFGAGTVSSVALSLPTSIFDVSGSPITTSGTFSVSLDSQDANKVWAGPVSGSAAAPTFRALVASDVPDISSTYLTTSAASTNYQPKDTELTALAGLTSASDALPYFTGSGTASTTTLTSFGRSLIDDTSASDARTTLNLGTMATEATSSYYTKTETDNAYQPKDATLTAVAGVSTSADKIIYFTDTDTASATTLSSFGRSLIDDTDSTAARTTLGLGTMATETASNYLTTSTASSTYQPLDGDLTALAGVTSAADKVPYFTGSGTADVTTLSSFGRSLIDDADSTAARTTLGLGTMATETASNYLTTTTASSTYLPLTGGTISSNLTVTGNLTVNGTTTTINSTTVTIDDKNFTLGDVTSPTDAGADGGGFTLKGTTDKTLNWVDATDAWTSSEHLNLLTGKSFYINGTSVLSGSTLGSGVTGSSLTSVGTIGTGTWQGTAVSMTYGGTGANLSGDATGTIYKKHASGYLTAATAGTDYLNNASAIDGGTY